MPKIAAMPASRFRQARCVSERVGPRKFFASPSVVFDDPRLTALHPFLRQIVSAELAAGNSIREIGEDWPEPRGILIRLAKPFSQDYSPIPAGVQFASINDPHWWNSEYFCGAPRQTVAG